MFEPKQKSKKDSRMKTSNECVPHICVVMKQTHCSHLAAPCFLYRLPTPEEIIAFSLWNTKTHVLTLCEYNKPETLINV